MVIKFKKILTPLNFLTALVIASIASTHADVRPIFTGTSDISVNFLVGSLQGVLATQSSVVKDDVVDLDFQLFVSSMFISNSTHINPPLLKYESYTRKSSGPNNADKPMVCIDAAKVDKSILKFSDFLWSRISIDKRFSNTAISSI